MAGGSTSSARRTGRAAVIILADGARADIFERLLAAGELPEIARHVVDRGSYRRACSTFTSTTIPAHLPILTGRFAGTAGLPGYRWFERTAWRRGLPLGPWCLRSYNGPESGLISRDLDSGAPTLFELAHSAVNVFGPITRGLARGCNLAVGRRNRLWLKAHYLGDYTSADDAARKELVRSLSTTGNTGGPELHFAMMPGIDWNSHYDSPFSSGALAAYRRVDRTVGAVARQLQRTGDYERTLIVVCSDHGHCPVDQHFDLPVRIERDHGLRVAYHSRRAWRRKAEAIVCVSGNAMAHVYLRAQRPWNAGPLDRAEIDSAAPGLVQRLLAEPAIDLVISRADAGPPTNLDPAITTSDVSVRGSAANAGSSTVARRTVLAQQASPLLVESRRGRALLREEAGGLRYEPLDDRADPFGYGPLPSWIPLDDALTRTFDTGHPDGLLQAAQIFRALRTGDMVISASPGYDLRERYEHPEHRSSHGALHAEHMSVPLAASSPLSEGPMRTADIFATVLSWLGRDASVGIDGRSRLCPAEERPLTAV